jgi:predicted AAA+ superfamily ATPase
MLEVIQQKIADSLATPAPRLTRRDVRLPKVAGKAKAVIGPRRGGKTTFLWQLLAERVAAGVPRSHLLYFNFEDERLADLRAIDLHLLVDGYFALRPEARSDHQAAFFLDEIQVVPGWETFVRRLLDTERLDIFLSGSSARLLSREVATSMRGRAMDVLVYPFSFREVLRHAGLEPTTVAKRWTKGERSVLDKALHAYLAGGGFPEAQSIDARDRFELLRGYVDTALFRDVVERHSVSHPTALRWLVRHLLSNAGGTFSVAKFYSDLRSQGIPVAKDTLHAYLAHLEDAFLVRSVPIATDSERRRMVNPRKAYPIDPGLIPVFDRSGKSNLGHALETAVVLELDRRGADVAYVRGGDGARGSDWEVDFLARYPDGSQQLIQVCADLHDPSARAREFRALECAALEYPRASRIIITIASEVVRDRPAGLQIFPAADWFLTVE